MTVLKNPLKTDLIDFHSHILPGIDDGARSPDESLKMLELMAAQGVSKVVSTSHFYPERESPESFLSRRAKAVGRLRTVMRDGLPDVYLGAEVAYFPGISRCEQLPELAIRGTRLILIEMPFCRWSPTVTDELFTIRDSMGLTPIIAHIERYIDQRPGAFGELAAGGILLQSNAEHFLDFWHKRRAIKLLENGYIHLLGSDCHRIDRRMPNLPEAAQYILDKLGEDAAEKPFLRAASLLK